ncbi:c-type cytochrome [Methylomonas sp. AM2-LC]|uniref:c-type cytochrome n=1 Tax=Methylomonas sp. AM2-LC TaxID=3153301 RepID=UPI0032633C7F
MKYSGKKPVSFKTLHISLLFAGWGVITTSYADINAPLMAYMCRNCHDPAGMSTPVVPALDKLTAQQFQKMLMDFKYDKQTAATIMPRIAKGYTDQELQALADYLSKH